MPRAPGPSGPEEVGSLYDRLAASLYRYALMILANRAEAEDVIQQVFVALVKRGTSSVDSAEHYLRRAVRNESYSTIRRRRREMASGTDSVTLEAFAGDVDRPDERIAIERALASLPADQREVVHLKVFEGLTFQEIADLAGESINTIASRYRYAMEKLRRTL